MVALPRSPYKSNDDLIAEATRYFEALPGAKPGKDGWINCSCPNADAHTHGDKKPSFGFNTVSGVGKCFACGNFSLWKVCDLIGIDRASDVTTFSKEARLKPALTVLPRPILDATWQANAERLVQRAHDYLLSARPDAVRVRQYLLDRRVDESLIRRWNLGYNPSWRDGLAPGITIPCYANGTLQYLKVRCRVGDLATALSIAPDQIDGRESPKYIQLKNGNSEAIFNADAIRPGLPTLILEGEFDVIVAQGCAGKSCAVITAGSASNAGNLARQCGDKLTAASNVLIGLDNDQTGRKNAAIIAAQLPGKACLVSLPGGAKDFTEYVTAGNDGAAWTSDQIERAVPSLQGFSDGIRSAALNCKLEGALTLAEICRTNGLTRFEVKQVVDLAALYGLAQSTVEKYLKQGKGIFSHESDSIVRVDNTNTIESESCGKPPGRPIKVYELLPDDTIRRELHNALPLALLRKHFPMREGYQGLPPENIYAADDQELSDADRTGLIDVLQKACSEQLTIADARKRWAVYQADRRVLFKELDKSTSTPIRWVNDSRFAVLFYRAVNEATDQARSRPEIARLTGCRASHTKTLIERAGLESVRQGEDGKLTFPIRPDRVVSDACRAATDKGRINRLIARHPDGTTAETTFDRSTAQAWACEQPAATEFVVEIDAKNRQVITGDVIPRKAPERRAPIDNEPARPREPEVRPVVLPKPKQDAVPVADDYYRDYLARVYAQREKVNFDDLPIDALTRREVIDLLLDRVQVDDQGTKNFLSLL